MHKLFRASHGHLSTTLRDHTKTLSPVSHLHSRRSENRDPTLHAAERSPEPSPHGRISRPESNSVEDRRVQISHPWPEWVEFIEFLVTRGFFRGHEKETKALRTEAKAIRKACLSFSRDQLNLIRFLSKKDIRVVVGSGCPSLDRKVINSGKRLRAHVGVDEGDTCGSCNLRGNCDRAYVETRDDEAGRTVDVMRIVLTYGLDTIAGAVENKRCLNEAVQESVRVLLKEIVKYGNKDSNLDSDLPKSRTLEKVVTVRGNSISEEEEERIHAPMKHGDWLCPKCHFQNFAKNIKCLRCNEFCEERLKKLREYQKDHLPLKKGDWICEKCNFMNFARNTKCFQCKENPTNRKINPGEWECPSCYYINFRTNVACLKCDHRRPKTENSSNNKRLTVDEGTQTHLQQENQNHIAYNWRFIEDENEEQHRCRNCKNVASDFLDFPITGGKGDLSRNKDKSENWKLEMLDMSKGIKVIKDDEFQSPPVPGRFEFSNLSDDQEMAKWFGP